MKKLLAFAAMFAAVSFSACSDDDDNGGKAPTPEKWVKQIKHYFEGDYSETTNITYDSENRVKKMDDFGRKDYEFTYNGNSLTVKRRDDYEDMTYTCKLNSDGYVTEVAEAETGYEKDGYDYKLEYKNGYLQRIEKRYRANNSRLAVTEFKWKNGNLIETKETDDDYRDDYHRRFTCKFSYSEKATPINVDVFYLTGFSDLFALGLFGFCGRQSAELVCEYEYEDEDEYEDENYRDFLNYTFNPDGTVKSINEGRVSYELIY